MIAVVPSKHATQLSQLARQPAPGKLLRPNCCAAGSVRAASTPARLSSVQGSRFAVNICSPGSPAGQMRPCPRRNLTWLQRRRLDRARPAKPPPRKYPPPWHNRTTATPQRRVGGLGGCPGCWPWHAIPSPIRGLPRATAGRACGEAWRSHKIAEGRLPRWLLGPGLRGRRPSVERGLLGLVPCEPCWCWRGA